MRHGHACAPGPTILRMQVALRMIQSDAFRRFCIVAAGLFLAAAIAWLVYDSIPFLRWLSENSGSDSD
jgi:hypothetical protein